MKRLHVHVAVDDLTHLIGFYSTLFAAEPAIVKPDCAKWMLNDPRVNFAISTRSGKSGLDHLGIQVETRDELQEVYARLQQADRPVLDEGATTCCYATSEKSWIADPQGLSWETFLTTGESTVYGDSADLGAIRTATPTACCTPETTQGGVARKLRFRRAAFANPAVAIARSLTNTFSGIRPIDLPGFVAAQLIGALCGMALISWLLREPAGQVACIKAEARL